MPVAQLPWRRWAISWVVIVVAGLAFGGAVLSLRMGDLPGGITEWLGTAISVAACLALWAVVCVAFRRGLRVRRSLVGVLAVVGIITVLVGTVLLFVDPFYFVW